MKAASVVFTVFYYISVYGVLYSNRVYTPLYIAMIPLYQYTLFSYTVLYDTQCIKWNSRRGDRRGVSLVIAHGKCVFEYVNTGMYDTYYKVQY